MEEAEQSPSCAEGITFYDLRPFFAAVHYGGQPLPRNMDLHMAGCESCRERWQFLVDTDPRWSEEYGREIEELSSRVAARAVEAKPSHIDIHEAIKGLLEMGQEVTGESVYGVWSVLGAIPKDDRWLDEQEHLADVCRNLLKQLGLESKSVDRLREIESQIAKGPVPVESILDFLVIARSPFTSITGVIEFQGSQAFLYPERLQQARSLFDQFIKANAAFGI